MKIIFLIVIMTLTSGCTYLFYHPDQIDYSQQIRKKMTVEEGTLYSSDKTKLTFLHFKTDAKKPKGFVLQFHGNAQNMTSHFLSLAWMVNEEFDLFTFDYRGYGQSEGSPSPKGLYEDGLAALRKVSDEARREGVPFIIYGQSLGGSVLLKILEDHIQEIQPKLVVIESSFYSYTGIAREKLASFWLSWPFQWLPYLLINNTYSPEGPALAKISPTPVLLIYSQQDPIVPISHGEKIYEQLKEPKAFWTYEEPGHIAGMAVQEGRFRKQLLEFIALLKTP